MFLFATGRDENKSCSSCFNRNIFNNKIRIRAYTSTITFTEIASNVLFVNFIVHNNMDWRIPNRIRITSVFFVTINKEIIVNICPNKIHPFFPEYCSRNDYKRSTLCGQIHLTYGLFDENRDRRDCTFLQTFSQSSWKWSKTTDKKHIM